jgi:dGTPase
MEWEKLLCSKRHGHSTSKKDERSEDKRCEFERDFDRAIFSTPVKRLQDKAQVFPLDPNDAVRTRLTHSLEVSSVARDLGIAIGAWLNEEKHIKPHMQRWIETICATCGLIHDLGNPPFGHAGEKAIQEWFQLRFDKNELTDICSDSQQLQDFLRFDGNAQSLRLVTKLQILVDFNGLNLTFGTLSASCKYIARSNETSKEDHARKKPGYFKSEEDIVTNIRENTGTDEARNPLTFLIEAADDIVYSVADVEDAVKKGVLSWQTIRKYLEKLSDPVIKEALDRMEIILKAGEDKVHDDLPDDIYASAFW